ncbi:cytochrome c oxidase assembly protein [Miltoncostaea marina]|uniref:cytochrome c oxidase assembly protein n=1 Tax=Miltoncostaea marina TaxID=2843215 RepID=UPI001C3C2543|nr:cytochrome c oxidase assembly protein [Miltoncostaea marina]
MAPALHAGPGALIGALPLLGLAAAAIAYVVAAGRRRAAGRAWPAWRVSTFLAGTALLAAALSPAVDARAGADFRVHAAQHIVVGMAAPVLLVLGAPLTLAIRSAPRRARRRVAPLLRSGWSHRVTHPATAVVLDMGGLVLLYLTPLYAATLTSAPLHALVHLHVLAAGCLLTWALIGSDPVARRPSTAVRAGALVAAAALHAVLAKLMYAHGWPAGTPHEAAELQAGAQLMYYGGDLVEVALAAVLLHGWLRRRGEADRRRAAWAAAG